MDVKGEILELKDTINKMVDNLNTFAGEVTRVAREVGTEGKLGGQAEVKGVAGTWKGLTDNVNAMAGSLTAQVRDIARVTTAVANGDLSQKITVDVKGEILQLKDTVNKMVDNLNTFAGEVTRVAREVGTEGKLGGQAEVKGVAGTWKGLTDNVNAMAGSLTAQVRDIARVTTAVANGDLSQKITVDVKGEILQLKDTINKMVDNLNTFAGEVTRVAREVGTEGKLGGQAEVKGVAGTWKGLTDNVNMLAGNLTDQVRDIAVVTTAVAKGDLSQKITVDVKGEILQLKNTINIMVDQLNSFASEVTRVAREVGFEGKLGGQAEVKGVAGTWKDLTDNVNAMAGSLTVAGARHRPRGHRHRQRRPGPEDHRGCQGRDPPAERNHQQMVDQLNAFAGGGDARGPRGRHRGQAGRPGPGQGGGGHLEGTDRQRQYAGGQPDQPGAQHCRGDHGRGQGRPVAEDHRRGAGRNPAAQKHHQYHGGSTELLCLGGDARGPRGGFRRQAGRPGRGQGGGRHLEGPDGQRQCHGRQPDRAGARHRPRGHGHRQRRPGPEDHRGCQGRDPPTERNHQS